MRAAVAILLVTALPAVAVQPRACQSTPTTSCCGETCNGCTPSAQPACSCPMREAPASPPAKAADGGERATSPLTHVVTLVPQLARMPLAHPADAGRARRSPAVPLYTLNATFLI
jgi:hypothetical protein